MPAQLPPLGPGKHLPSAARIRPRASLGRKRQTSRSLPGSPWLGHVRWQLPLHRQAASFVVECTGTQREIKRYIAVYVKCLYSTPIMQAHHAVVFEGDMRAAETAALSYVEETLGLTPRKNPDVSVTHFEQFTINDARDLKQRAMQAPIGERQVFVLVFEKVTVPAQHALLKLLEEPAENTHIVLVLPEVGQLLRTVQSRLAYVGCFLGEPTEVARAAEFLSAGTQARIKLVQHLYINVKDDAKIHYRNKARVFLDAVEYQLHQRGVHDHTADLREVAFVRQYINDPSSSLKMLLEHLAYTLRQ